MAEPLRNSFGRDVPERIAAMVGPVYPAFDRPAFVAWALDGYDVLELTARARRISAALARFLPQDPESAIRILVASLPPPGERMKGMEPFIFLPHVYFVAENGLGCLEVSLHAQYELTQRFTAEFSIRPFLEQHPDRTLDALRRWATDPNVHVRRLVSEGTRPRLPWAARLRRFQEDPRPVLALLELLRDDPEEYVRRSVANNLNDISRDHPELVVDVCRRWLQDASEPRRALVRHALRTLVKQGHAGALAALGFDRESPVAVTRLTVSPLRARIGGKVTAEIEVQNPSRVEQSVVVDLRVHFVKANGTCRPKVFKGATFRLAPGEAAGARKSVSLAQQTTRTHYPGPHRVEVMLNGVVRATASFDVLAAAGA